MEMDRKKTIMITLLQGCMVVLVLGILAQLYHLQFVRRDHYWQKAKERQELKVKKFPTRGKILDRNNSELAATEMVPTIYVAPSRIPEWFKRTYAAEMAQDLARELGIDFDTVFAHLTQAKGDKVIKRRTDYDAVQRAIAIVDKYRMKKHEKTTETLPRNVIYVQEENKRIYPWEDLASHVIGFTELDDTGDNKGQAGVEGSYDSELRGKIGIDVVLRTATNVPLEAVEPEVLAATYGNTVVLTIDSTIQRATENALKKRVLESSADAGVAIVYAVKTGEVLSMASVPSFSLTDRAHAAPFAMRNRAITDAIEPGSVMKIFTYTSLLEEDKLRSFKEIIDCSGGRWTVAGRTVVDSHSMGAVPIVTAFAESSNVAAAKLAVTRLQPSRFYKHLVDFGFGEKTGIDLPGESPGFLRHVKEWTAQSIASLAYGYELQVTAIQVAAAAAAIANNGIYMKPHVVREVRNYRGEVVRQILPETVRRVCSPTTSRRMRELMEAVVTEGTGKSAQIPGYRVGGKTGTTIKLDPETKRYSKGNYIASFCGIAPLEDPEICIYVWIDNPRGGQYYGGQVSAPVFKEIAQTALKVLKIPPSSKEPPVKSIDVVLDGMRKPAVPVGYLEPAPEDEPVAPGCMPDLRGLTMREAHERLASLNLAFETQGSGVVVDQQPKPFETIDPREPVRLVFGSEEEYRNSRMTAASSAETPPREGVSTEGNPTPTPSVSIVRGKQHITVPVTVEQTSRTLGIGKASVAAIVPSPTPTPPETPSGEDPDVRVKRGPAPDVGKTVWKKVIKDSIDSSTPHTDTPPENSSGKEDPSGASRPQGERTPSQVPVKSLYDVLETSNRQPPQEREE